MILTFYSDSHEELFNIMMGSISDSDRSLLKVYKIDQGASDGIYRSEGWGDMMTKKLELIIETLDQSNAPDRLLYSDCDVRFYGEVFPQVSALLDRSGFDILFQADSPVAVCMGFFIVKNSEAVLRFFKVCHHILSKGGFISDQEVANLLLGSSNLKAGLLGAEFFSIWRSIGCRVWDPSIPLGPIPDGILVHHASWVKGSKDKIDLIKRVQNLVEAQR